LNGKENLPLGQVILISGFSLFSIMIKIPIIAALCLFAIFASAQSPSSIQPPDEFLGYPLGAHYTPHYKLIAYFKQVAEHASKQVRLLNYGKTNEGRPLMIAIVASESNMQRLESIRLNNLRLAGILKDNISPDENAPAIVWLSYNVHGNEASSSEASMKTLYELVNPANAEARSWLDHVVVILDPCMNPDGRDRYVNWYNSTVGQSPNEDPQSREHFEPWPGGRTNHYFFDLNRDWAWQTQIETRERMKVYNLWLPQVHVDFHEQGYNSPYYFAPAAEPYHEVITAWQRQFQVLIGKNNAKYFDKNGWLFFTKERFDLFYPSYGDTYPIYNGAIGMTFEQGGIRAGLSVLNQAGDTLKLSDRLLHHFTTGMSTIEVSSRESGRLLHEFRNYFNNARSNPTGEFKAFLIKTEGSRDRTETLIALLERNLIQWRWINEGSFNGLNYFSGRTESFQVEPGDILINLNQCKSNLIKVLFERNSKISDSATYDITAWSIPFSFGLKTYGLNAFVNSEGKDKPENQSDTTDLESSYAYAIPWKGIKSAEFLCSALKRGLKIRYSDEAFESGSMRFEKGTLLVLPAGNANFSVNGKELVKGLVRETGVQAYPIGSGLVDKGPDFGSEKIHLIRRPRVALMTGEGVSSNEAGEVWHFFDQSLHYPLSLINADDLSRINLRNYDVLILPDGDYRFLKDKSRTDELKEWVQQGGKLIAEEEAVEVLSKTDWALKTKPKEDKEEDGAKEIGYADLKRYENRERDEISSSTPGAIYKVELDNSHPLAYGYPGFYYTLKLDDRVYQFFKEGGWNVGIIRKNNYVSGFTGSKAKDLLEDGLVFGVQDLGKGELVYLADDPLFRSFWENGKLLFCNAVFMVGQ
jgi:hypothetical protein